MKKLTALMIIAAIMLFSAAGCAVKVSETANESKNGVSVSLGEYHIEKNKRSGSTVFQMNFIIENGSADEIMEVSFDVDYFDAKGELVESSHVSYNAQDAPIPPGGKAEHYYGFQDKIDSPPRTLAIKVTGTSTSEEVPPVHLPQEGEYLYEALNNEHVNNIDKEMPVKVDMLIDHGGMSETAAITDPEAIAGIVEAFMKIKIGRETDEFATDNYNGFSFTFSDGETAFISLNLMNLEVSAYGNYHLYELEDFGGFWRLMNELTEYED